VGDTELVGRASVAGPTMSDLSDSFGLEALIPSPLAIISDARIGARTDKARVAERLLSISGKDRMTVSRKFKPAWTGKLLTRIWIMTNDLPALNDGSSALAGRFVILLYPNSFYEKEDPKLASKLVRELPGILNWAIEGYRKLNKRGHFVQPANAKETMEEIEALGAPIKAFVRDMCVLGSTHSVTADALFKEYLDWAVRNKQNSYNKEWFARELRSAVPGLKSERRRAAGKPGDRTEGDKKDLRDLYYLGVDLAPL
jgi:putative DNA primase/helicase